MEFASKAQGNAGVTLGTIGTVLGGVSSMGGLAGLFGVAPKAQSTDPGDRPVTRYEMDLIQKNIDLANENVLLKAKGYSDAKDAGIQAYMAGANATIGFMNQRIQELYGITQLMVPNSSVAPGWGPAMVRPFPPFPPVPPVTPPATDAAGASTASGG